MDDAPQVSSHLLSASSTQNMVVQFSLIKTPPPQNTDREKLYVEVSAPPYLPGILSDTGVLSIFTYIILASRAVERHPRQPRLYRYASQSFCQRTKKNTNSWWQKSEPRLSGVKRSLRP